MECRLLEEDVATRLFKMKVGHEEELRSAQGLIGEEVKKAVETTTLEANE